MQLLLRQGYALPFLFFVPVLIAGFLLPDYSAIAEHGSVMTLSHNAWARNLVKFGALSSGISCVLLALGLVLNIGKRVALSAVLMSIFGIGMISNGIWPMGSPLHGLYGAPIVMMILPFALAYEVKGMPLPTLFFRLTIVAGLVNFVYSWALLVGLDPVEYMGLTQRLASITMFGWLGYTAYHLNRALRLQAGSVQPAA